MLGSVFGGELFSQVLNMSVTACCVILIVLLARVRLARMPKIFSYALWGVVLFRLLCPVAVSTDFSLLGLLDIPTEKMGGRISVTEYISSDPAAEIWQDELNANAARDNHNAGGNWEDTGIASEQSSGRTIQCADISVSSVTSGIWLFGMVAMAAYSIVSFSRLKKSLVGAVRLTDNIYLADHLVSPFVIRVFRPRIYLPSGLTDREQEYIVLHEQHHIRRGDHVIKLLAFLALCIHWFNPLVWAAFVLAGKDMEMSCDEAVVRKLGGDIRADYSASLLKLATGRRIIAGNPLAFGEGDTKERIKNLAKWKKPVLWLSVVTAVVCAVLLISLFTNPNRYVSQIRINGINYVLQEDTVSVRPANASEIGSLTGIVHKTTDDPEQDFYGTNLDEKYAGCMMYQTWWDRDVIYLEDYSGYYLVFSAEQSTPFGYTWELGELVYQFSSSYPYTAENAPAYGLSIAREMYVIFIDEAENKGVFESVSLTKDNFDRYFTLANEMAEWTSGNNQAETIRRENAYAWKLDIWESGTEIAGSFYYLLLQKNGTVYLAKGNYDPQGENHSIADDTFVCWLAELKKCDMEVGKNDQENERLQTESWFTWQENDLTGDIPEFAGGDRIAYMGDMYMAELYYDNVSEEEFSAYIEILAQEGFEKKGYTQQLTGSFGMCYYTELSNGEKNVLLDFRGDGEVEMKVWYSENSTYNY